MIETVELCSNRSSPRRNMHSISLHLILKPLNGSEAQADLVLIQTLLFLICKSFSYFANQFLVSIMSRSTRTSLSYRGLIEYKGKQIPELLPFLTLHESNQNEQKSFYLLTNSKTCTHKYWLSRPVMKKPLKPSSLTLDLFFNSPSTNFSEGGNLP